MPPVIVWFTDDLRLSDHPALVAAAQSGAAVLPVYILDDETPGRLRPGGASRWWLHGSLAALDKALHAHGGALCLRRGRAASVLSGLLAETGAQGIYATRGYEPWRPALDRTIEDACASRSAIYRTFPGRLLFEPDEVLTGGGGPYRVFTPFWKACLKRGSPRAPLSTPRLSFAAADSDTLDSFGLLPKKPDWAAGLRETWIPGEQAARARLDHFVEHHIQHYADDRNNLDAESTSRLSPRLHFGELSPNQIWHAVTNAAAKSGGKLDRGAEAFLRELGWREFSYHLLAHFPTLPSEPLRPEFADFPWRSDADALNAWQHGMTGYPIVDAAMRDLWLTGYMPNRARMIVTSFLVKHLLIPWQAGADWFLDTLCDADLANNSASWQWVAGCGADAAPYFRVFNPVLQGKRFDPDGTYVRRYVPELAALATAHIHTPWEAPPMTLAEAGVKLGGTYPLPIVDQAAGRARALQAYDTIVKG